MKELELSLGASGLNSACRINGELFPCTRVEVSVSGWEPTVVHIETSADDESLATMHGFLVEREEDAEELIATLELARNCKNILSSRYNEGMSQEEMLSMLEQVWLDFRH